MIARAPGKLVVSGAYSVLEGAPAIVTAVDRYVLADATQPATMTTPEVQAAIELGFLDRACHFDASALRCSTPSGEHKLGLGSSAAILVATMVAVELTRARARSLDAATRARIHGEATRAHERAQGGGSGVDVAAATYGGTLRFVRSSSSELPVVSAWAFPNGARLTAWTTGRPAVTSELLGRVGALRREAPRLYGDHIAEAARHAEVAVGCTEIEALARALFDQARALRALGVAAGAPIVDDATWELSERAAEEGCYFGPSGAGGGDIAIFVGGGSPPAAWVERAKVAGFVQVELEAGAPGADLVESSK